MTPVLVFLALLSCGLASTCNDELEQYRPHAAFALALALLAATVVLLHPVAPLWLRVIILVTELTLLFRVSPLLLTFILLPVLVALHDLSPAPLFSGAFLLAVVIAASTLITVRERPRTWLAALRRAVIAWWPSLLAAGVLPAIIFK